MRTAISDRVVFIFRPRQLRKRLRCSQDTLRRILDGQIIPNTRLSDREYLVDHADLRCRRCFTPKELRRIVDCCQDTLKRMLDNQTIPNTKVSDKLYLIDWEALPGRLRPAPFAARQLENVFIAPSLLPGASRVALASVQPFVVTANSERGC